MRILIVDTYYQGFLRKVYGEDPALESRSYSEQWQRLMGQCFGTADFFSANLKKLGHEATDIVVNCEPLQAQWARENGGRVPRKRGWRRIGRVPLPRLAVDGQAILSEQIRAFRPDVIHFQDPGATDPDFVRSLRPLIGRITAQIASGVPEGADFSCFDLVLSSFPHFVERFPQSGWRAAYQRLGFEATLTERLHAAREFDVVFVGGISPGHRKRLDFLESVARAVPLKWWGYGIEALPENSPLREAYQGPAWGIEMYDKLFRARISLNFHLDIAEGFANNMRLFEATGAGSCLITDDKQNLGELFERNREIVTYGSTAECIERIRYYLDHEAERKAIAEAGQRRTLAEHSYLRRMEEYVEIVGRIVR